MAAVEGLVRPGGGEEEEVMGGGKALVDRAAEKKEKVVGMVVGWGVKVVVVG